ncbi:hypothetical protein [Streptomyces sp. NPDC058964]|uniref:hypothetical protein n=1 Tax=Streptomyces sp. NPDC058964 TaxID=3346681 RepID=UPI0036B7BE13
MPEGFEAGVESIVPITKARWPEPAGLADRGAPPGDQSQPGRHPHGSEEGTGLARYATLDALGQTRLDLMWMKEAGTVVRGEVGHEPKVTSLDQKAATPKATLSDCIDLSRCQTYDTRAKKVIPLPTSQPLRYRATAKAERWKGRWMVTDVDTGGGGSC